MKITLHGSLSFGDTVSDPDAYSSFISNFRFYGFIRIDFKLVRKLVNSEVVCQFRYSLFLIPYSLFHPGRHAVTSTAAVPSSPALSSEKPASAPPLHAGLCVGVASHGCPFVSDGRAAVRREVAR